MQFQETLLLCLCIYITWQVREIVCIKVQTISHTLPFATKLFQDTREQPSPRLVYGVCDTAELVHKRSCTLVIESNAPRNSSDHLRFCDIVIRSDGIPMSNIKYIYALDDDTAIVQWTSRYSRFAIVHFSDCRVVYPRIGDDWKISLDLIRAPFNGTFDVVVQEYENGRSCLGKKWCRLIFDANGNVLEYPPRRWIHVDDDIIDVAHTNDGKRLIVGVNRYNRSSTYVRVYKAHDDRTFTIYGEYPAGNLYASSSKIAVSSTHQLITICALNYMNLTCGQFDHRGVLKLQTNFRPLNFSDINSAKVFNLPNGGFVLLTTKCLSGEYLDECFFIDEEFFSITILDATTKILTSIKIAQLKCGEEFNLDNIHYVENEEKKICLSYVCDYRGKDEGRVSVEVNCFTKQDLSG